MAVPSITYTSFPTGTTADGSQVITNFNDLIAALTDGTKDLTIAALTCNGAVTLGNATSDDITITGRIASDFDPKTAATYTLGDATQTWQSLSLDNTATDGGAIYFDAGTTEYIKSSADGSELDFGGFTTMTFGETTAFNVGDGTDADVALTITADSGDAKISLDVNASGGANQWDIYNDNGSSDDLDFAYNGTTLIEFQTDGEITAAALDITGTIDTDAACQASYFLPDGDDASAPGANRLYKANVPKAWAKLEIDAASPGVVTDDHNIAGITWAADVATVEIDTNMANSTYCVVASIDSNTSIQMILPSNRAVGTFDLYSWKHDGTTPNFSILNDLNVIVMGDQ